MRWTSSAWVLAACFGVAAGCDDSTGLDLSPILVTDTVVVVAPLPQNAGQPTALDITSDGAFGIIGGRFPERVRDALAWDFAVRIRDGELVLVPARALGITESRAALSRAIEGATFEGLRQVPSERSLFMDSVIVMRAGSVHAARSRQFAINLFGGGCVQYAKLEPLEVDVTAGRLRVRVVTNERCSDPRLVPDE